MVVGIKNIKFNAWEPLLIKQIDDTRKNEKSMFIKIFAIKGVGEAISNMIPMFALIIVIWVHNATHDTRLSVGDMFYIIMVVGQLVRPFTLMVYSLLTIASSIISLERFKQINSLDDLNEQPNETTLPLGSVIITNATFSWTSPQVEAIFSQSKHNSSNNSHNNNKKDSNNTQKDNNSNNNHDSQDKDKDNSSPLVLSGISLSLLPASFTVVLGKVGSGKSALLFACLDELVRVSGLVSKHGRVGFVPQEAFLVNDTLKQNVLFGHAFDEIRYRRAVTVAQLDADLHELPGGEETEIGERGINLSGGQKQRVMLARAVYCESEIYLVDDCLSALDAGVGQRVWEDVLCGEMRGKTRLLATHHLHRLADSRIDNIILLKDGQIVAQGKFEELKEKSEYIEFAH